MSIKPARASSEQKPKRDFEEELRDMNEELLVSSVHQHELVEKAEKAEESLRVSEEQFRLGIVNAPIPVIMHAEDGEVLQVSNSWTALTGYTHKDEKVIQSWLTEAYGLGGERVRDAMHHAFLPTQNGEKSMRAVSFEIITRDGEQRTWSFNASVPGVLADGRRFVVGMAEDITTRVKAEKLLFDNQTYLAESQMRLAMELSATQKLQEVSTELIGEGDPKSLYGKITEAAVAIMRAQSACLQLFDPGRGKRGEFHLLSHHGFNSRTAKYLETICPSSANISGVVLDTGKPVSVPNIEASDLLAGNDDLPVFTRNGIHAVQATPLISRAGKMLGLISTYWRQPHQPVERDLRLLDVLARQAADLIERSQAEAALRESEQQFITLADSIPQLAWMAEPDGSIFWYNQRWYDFTGTTFEAMEGWGWQSVHDPEILPKVVELWKHSIATGQLFEMEFPLLGTDGTYRWFLTRVFPLRNTAGSIVRWFGTNTDVQVHKEIERALRDSEEKYRSLFDSIDEGFCTVEMIFDENEKPVDYRFLEINPAFAQQTGLENAIGKRMRELAPLHEEHWYATYGRVALTGESVRFVHRAEQLHRWFDVFASSIGGAGSRKVAIVFNDITGRKQTEEELRRTREELEQRVIERTAELADANTNVIAENRERRKVEEERVRILHQLVTAQEDERRRIGRDLHDQLGQQVTALRLKLEAMAAIAEGDEVFSEHVKKAQEYAKQIDTDVGFLTFELRPTALDDLGLVAAAQNFVYEWSVNHNIEAEFHAAPAISDRLDPQIEINLYRIVQEALNNIVKYAKAKTVTVQLDFRNANLILIIEDDGVGFDTENGKSVSNSGNGLGLIGMSERCLLLGGTLEIESAPGKGTVIFARVPA